MALESLSEKLQNIFRSLRGKGRLSEADVKSAMKEVRMALLEADVNFRVVKQFVAAVTERAVGSDVLESLTPGQQVIKIVNEELIHLMGDTVKEPALLPPGEISVIMLCGLQGAGKTTTAAKLAAKYRSSGRKPLLAALDVHRPAAIEQLKVNGEKLGIEVFSMGTGHAPADIAKAALEHARKNGFNLIILDTAGRLHIDEEMMQELRDVEKTVDITSRLLVVDAMTGQDAVNVAGTFDQEIGIDGVILTKLDGDTRGGAALSIVSVTGKPICYVGMGEKPENLELFYPDRMASRILGMGDVLTLIEKAQAAYDEKSAREMAEKMSKAQFDFNDYLEQSAQLRKMGDISELLGMLPGVGGQLKNAQMPDERSMRRVEAIIMSMTPYERSHPDDIGVSRRRRIATGAGVDISEVNRLIKQFGESRKMMKQMSGMMGKKNRFGKFRFPFS